MSVPTPQNSAPTVPDPLSADRRSRVVGVVIVTYNSGALIEDCLSALHAAASGCSLRVVVVDNDSSDDVVARARRHPSRPRTVETGVNGGYSAGINVGLLALREWGEETGEPLDAVLVLNPDCRLAPGAVDALDGALVASGAGVVAPLILSPEGEIFHSIFRDPTVVRGFASAVLGDRVAGRFPLLGEQETRDDHYRSARDIDAASGAVLLIASECAAAVGPWDEGYFLYAEETDFQMRARRRGHTVRFDPAAVATHDGGDSEVSPRLWALLTVNRVRFFAKFHGPFATAAYHAAVLLGELRRVVGGRAPSRVAVRALLSPTRRRALYPDPADEPKQDH